MHSGANDAPPWDAEARILKSNRNTRSVPGQG